MIDIRLGDRRAAFEAPFNIYPSDSLYVSPMWSDLDRILDPNRNPLVTEGHGRFQLYTAHRDGRAVGRIVASIHDAANQREGGRRGAFGFFDCGDDRQVASALLGAAETWTGQRGMTSISGNFNLTAMQQMGVVTDGFDRRPYTDMVWNPPHIPRLLRENGYEPSFPARTFEVDLTTLDPDAGMDAKRRAKLADPDYRWVEIGRHRFKDKLLAAREVLNAGFDANPMFVPTSEAEFLFQAGEMMWIVDRRIAALVEYQGKPAGVIVCAPDLNPFVQACRSQYRWNTIWQFLKFRARRERAVIIFYSVVPELQGQGLNGAMLYRVLSALKASGYKSLGCTWIADVNTASLKQVERFGGTPHHRTHLFEKALDGAISA
jgi:GNAT superfamily N-acetyltransferase